MEILETKLESGARFMAKNKKHKKLVMTNERETETIADRSGVEFMFYCE